MDIDAILAAYAALRDQLHGVLTSASPLLFFSMMALLPVVGAPVSIFFLLCAGYGWAIAVPGVTLATAVNLSLSYALAHSVARPLLERLIRRTRYRIPRVRPDNQLQVLLILRLTPGIPFALQNYLLGMTRVPFGLYLGCSLPIMLAWALGFVMLGESFFSGDLGLAAVAVVALLLLSLAARRFAARARKAGEAAADQSSRQ